MARPASKLITRKKTEEMAQLMAQLTKCFPCVLEAKFQSPESHRKLGLAVEAYNPNSGGGGREGANTGGSLRLIWQLALPN